MISPHSILNPVWRKNLVRVVAERLSSLAKIIVEKASQHLASANGSRRRMCRRSNGHLLLNALMGSCAVVEINILGQRTPQMRLAEDHDRIQTFLADGTDPTFGKGVGLGCLTGGQHNFHARGSKDRVKGGGELAVMVMDQETQGFRTGARFTQLPGELTSLLGHPSGVRLIGAARQIHPAGVQFDEEQHVNGLQPQGLDGEEIAGQHLMLVVVQERAPRAAATLRCGRETMAPHHVLHGLGIEVEPQLE